MCPELMVYNKWSYERPFVPPLRKGLIKILIYNNIFFIAMRIFFIFVAILFNMEQKIKQWKIIYFEIMRIDHFTTIIWFIESIK